MPPAINDTIRSHGVVMNAPRTAVSNLSVSRVICLAILSAGMLGTCGRVSASDQSGEIQFARDVRPILSNHCWSCHGPDEPGRQGNLRLDLRDDAIRGGESGKAAIVPVRPADSEMMKRILSHDADLQMPPASTKKPLSAEQIQILQSWIEQGAPFAAHWAFETPQRPAVPAVNQTDWAKNDIDRFILSRLEKEKLSPSQEASPNEWLRRVSLDLTGLPPSIEELDQFESALATQPRDVVYESVVDRLLASDRHAERMAMQWLDAARYADTNGYNNDEIRTMWPWRDWVIDAYRRDLPYDQFLTEQLAGDLLPNATIAQKVATGFCRNHVLTTEVALSKRSITSNTSPIEFTRCRPCFSRCRCNVLGAMITNMIPSRSEITISFRRSSTTCRTKSCHTTKHEWQSLCCRFLRPSSSGTQPDCRQNNGD